MLKMLQFISSEKKKTAVMILFLLLQVSGTLYIPTLMASIINNGIMKSDLNHIWRTGGIMVIAAIVTSLVSICGTYLSSHLASLLGRNIRNALIGQVQRLSLNQFHEFGTASLITRTTSDVNVIQQTFSYIVEMLLPAPFMTVAGLLLAFSKDKTLALLIVGSMVLVIVCTFLIGRKAIPCFGTLQQVLDNMNNRLRETITGVRVIRAFNRFEDEKAKADGLFTQYAGISIRANKLFALAMPVIMLVMNMSAVLIIWFGGQKAAVGGIQIGDIMTLIEYSAITLMYLVMGGMVLIMIPRAQTSASRINQVLGRVAEAGGTDVTGSTAAGATGSSDGMAAGATGGSGSMAAGATGGSGSMAAGATGGSGSMAAGATGGSNVTAAPLIEFKQVCFQYEGAEKPTLDHISFCLYPGETMAIIGGTGSGKSSIAQLISGFYSIQQGEILIHGRNIASMPESRLRSKIGYVPQKAFLFSGTIADNLRHGKKNATLADMKKACAVAQADSFVENLENGYDSSVSQAGNNFSGGQKQRLAIARAIIKEPDIYLFDDSFSALDFQTDARLREALKQETLHSAVIIIAQRITTIMNADKILVLDEGKTAGLGSHRELLAHCHIYQQIAKSQLSEEELRNEY